MTVRELRAKLFECNQDAKVTYLYYDPGDGMEGDRELDIVTLDTRQFGKVLLTPYMEIVYG